MYCYVYYIYRIHGVLISVYSIYRLNIGKVCIEMGVRYKPKQMPMVRYLIIEKVCVYNAVVDIDVSVDTPTFNDSNIKLYG